MAVRTFEQQLAALRTLDPAAPTSADELRKVLRSKRGLLIAVVAKLVEEHRLEALVEDLAACFGTLVADGAKVDPGCRGKLAIAQALIALEEWDARVFVAGLTIVQREGPPGMMGAPPEDTAPALRGLCGLAHVHFYRSNALDVLATLLADEERNARLAAAQGFGNSGRTDTTALLRYKLLLENEDEPEVLAQCFESLFALAREETAEFAVAMLERDGAIAEAAALALGGARIATATTALASWCERCRPEQRHRVGYIALALLRTDEANAVLLAAIRDGGRGAVPAAKALATFKDDVAIAASVREAIAGVDAKTRKEIEAIL
ncbi:MAG: hypothetical protein M4D80_39030 [Myxococcota bacterium]|nr:hypothetical protein [Deltaproteobacteria bacterium]MDQ3341186.1 hypothetical protein [Myxococcota bacterium]